MKILMRKTVSDGGRCYEAGKDYDSTAFKPGQIKYYKDKGWIAEEIQEPVKANKTALSTEVSAKEAIEAIGKMSASEAQDYTEGEKRVGVLKALADKLVG